MPRYRPNSAVVASALLVSSVLFLSMVLQPARPVPVQRKPAVAAGHIVRPVAGDVQVTSVLPGGFGLVGDGVADDTAALQAWINGDKPGTASDPWNTDARRLPAGTYKVTDTLLVSSASGLVVQGDGRDVTKIKWAGPSNKPVFRLSRCTRCGLRSLALVNHSGTAVTVAAVELDTVASAVPGQISTDCRFEDLSFRQDGNLGWKYLFDVDYRLYGGTDNNNEFHKFVDVDGNNYTTAALHVFGSQAHDLLIRDCSFNGNIYGAPYGLHFEYGTYASIERCNIGYHSAWDIYGGNFLVRLDIDGWNSEQSAGGLNLTDTGTGSVSLQHVRWDGAMPAPGTSRWFADLALGDGSLTVENVKASSSGAGAGRQPRFRVTSAASVFGRGVGMTALNGTVKPPGDVPVVVTADSVDVRGIISSNGVTTNVIDSLTPDTDITRGRTAVALKAEYAVSGQGYANYAGKPAAGDTRSDLTVFDGTSWSLAFDFRADGATAGQWMLSAGLAAAGTYYDTPVAVRSTNGTEVRVEWVPQYGGAGHTSPNVTLSWPTGLTPGAWQRLLICFDADAGMLYARLNGSELSGAVGQTFPLTDPPKVAWGPVFPGRIRFQQVWDRCLSATERASLDGGKVVVP